MLTVFFVIRVGLAPSRCFPIGDEFGGPRRRESLGIDPRSSNGDEQQGMQPS